MRKWIRCTAWLVLAWPLFGPRSTLAQPQPPPAQSQPPAQSPAQPSEDADDDDAEDETPKDKPGSTDSTPPAPAAGEPDPARKPPPGKGAVWGVITDADNKEPVIDASVTVVGTKHKAIADIDGRFRLELPPGTYELRVWYELYRARRVQNLRITAGRVERVDVRLELDKAAEEEIEIELDPVRASATTQLAIRKNAPTVGDAVSAQEIAKTPDRNAADAARRVVGASVIGNKYVYVRGLGERYTNSLLNGVPLPSPEPDKQAVPLDLFPSLILSDLTITKTFTPDMPGDFAGGSVRINTRDLPEKFLLQGTLSVGFNTASTFRNRLTYRGSSTDWLGIDSGTRALPADFPTYKLTRLGDKPDGTKVLNDELAFWGRQLNAYMTTERTVNPPHMSGNVLVGDTLKFGVNQRLGYSAALTYGRKFSTRADEHLNRYYVAPNTPSGLAPKYTYVSESGLDGVSWGGFLGLAYRPTRGQKVTLMGIHSRSSENEARFFEGFYEDLGVDIRSTRLKFVSRSLSFGQLAGEHKLPLWNNPSIDWNLSLSLATADEPDTRETVYREDTPGAYFFLDNTQSGSHLWTGQRETAVSGGVDLLQPLIGGDAPTTMKLGSLFSLRSRKFDIRRFRFRSNGAPLEQPPDQLFSSANIGTTLQLDEYTRDSDGYIADQELFAGYLMTDSWITARLRLILGARVEASSQAPETFNPVAPDQRGIRTELATTDLLPSANVVIKTTDNTNLRFSISRTVARPQLRELAPVLYTENIGAVETYGNPDLKRTTIYNGDIRFEFFPTPAEVLALSIFYKQVYDPIEQVRLAGSNAGTKTFQSANVARNAGAEVEARKGLGFIHPVLADLTVLGNVTFVYSRVELKEQPGTSQTNEERPLEGQSPFVVNVGIDYNNEKTGTRARLLYNVFGSRISTVGQNELPDEYERPRHQLDATVAQKIRAHFDVKLAVENILNAPTVFTHGNEYILDENTTQRYITGATFTLSGTYTY